MTLKELKTIGKFTNEQLSLIFGCERHTIARWLVDESKLPIWIKIYLEWL